MSVLPRACLLFFIFVSAVARAQSPSEDPQLAAPATTSSGVTTPGAALAAPTQSAGTATAPAAPTQATQPAGPSVDTASQVSPQTTPQAASGPAASNNPMQLLLFGRPTPNPSATPFIASDVETYTPHQDVRAVVKTSMGTFTIRLQPYRAPRNVENFIALAKGTQPFIDVKTSKKVTRPFYNGLTFHRVITGYLIQGGCPFGNGRGGPGYSIPDETSPFAKFNKPGIVAMAGGRKGIDVEKDSNGSQFFITVSPQPQWDGKFTVIGEVESGMDVVERISKARTGPADKPIHRITIISIDIVRT